MQVEFIARELGSDTQGIPLLILREVGGKNEILLKLSELQSTTASFLLNQQKPTIPVNYISILSILTTFSAVPISVTLEKGPNQSLCCQLLCEANGIPYTFNFSAIKGILLAMYANKPILVAKRHIADFATQSQLSKHLSDEAIAVEVNTSKHVH